MEARFILAAALTITAHSTLAQVYLGLEGGVAQTNIDNDVAMQKVAQITGSAPELHYDKDTYFRRVFLGVTLNEYVDFQLGTFSVGRAEVKYTNNLSNGWEAYSGKGSDLSVRFKMFSTGMFIRGGVHHSRQYYSGSFSFLGNQNSNAYSKSGSGLLAGFGYEHNILSSGKDFLSIEYKYYNDIGGDSRMGANIISLGYRRQF